MRPAVVLFLVPLAALSAACRTTAPSSKPVIVQPGAPGEASRVIAADKAADLSRVQHTPADVTFMQGMIGHHAQALEMSALVPSRSTSEDMRMLAKRIEVSQADEIVMMKRWLEARGQAVPSTGPGEHAHHMHDAKLMPGMLTPEEMQRLAAAKGQAFERLFLEGMIKHHEGALTMVKELFAVPGAGQESDMFAFTADVDADQRMEIDRMAGMLRSRANDSR